MNDAVVRRVRVRIGACIAVGTFAGFAVKAVAQDVTCAADASATAELPPSLQAEAPLISFAQTIDLVPRSSIAARFTTLTVSPERVAAIGRQIHPGAPPARLGTNTPTVRIEATTLEQRRTTATRVPSLSELIDQRNLEARITGPSFGGATFQRVVPREIADEFGARLPSNPQDPPPSRQTAPWVALSPEEIARRGTSCTAVVVQELENAAKVVTKEFGYGAEEVALHLDELLQAQSDSRMHADKHRAAARYVNAYAAMLDNCTRPANGNHAFVTSGLRERLGTLSLGSKGFCTALLLGPRHVLTARHCLFDAKEGGFSRRDANITDFWVVLDGPLQRAQVCAVTNPGPTIAFGAGADHMLLRIANTGRKLSAPALVGEEALKDGRARPTEFASFSLFPGSDRLGKGSPLGLVEYTGSACLVFKKNGSCYYHGCGAQAGSSGAPLFLREQMNEGKLALAGLHVGRASSTPDCPKTGFAETNVANSLPPALLHPFTP